MHLIVFANPLENDFATSVMVLLTGSPGAVARPRFPQNVACGFPAPRSSTGGSQHFAAIRSRFVSTVSFILSLHRGLSLPLHGARVAPERVICRQPLPPVNGSPVLRVLSAGLTSARPSDRPCLGGLSGPTGLRLNRTDLPCSRQVLRLHAGGTNPGSVPAHLPCRGVG